MYQLYVFLILINYLFYFIINNLQIYTYDQFDNLFLFLINIYNF